MTSATRLILTLALAMPLFAQERPAGTAATATTTAAAAETTTSPTTTSLDDAGDETTATAADDEPAEGAVDERELRPSSYEIRAGLSSVIRNSTPELARILGLEPSLLANGAFVAQYPRLAEFVAKYPEVKSHTHFYLAEFEPQQQPRGPIDNLLEPLFALVGVIFVTLAVAWLVRTLIEQRRWARLSRSQAEVHNKILDRFGTSTELLEYIRTPAGTKFLESAPIPLHAEPAPSQNQNASLNRTMWSIQIGVVVAAGALGMLLVSARYSDSGHELFAMGMIILCVGLGFVGSAALSLYLSRRLGVLLGPSEQPQQPQARPTATPEEGVMR